MKASLRSVRIAPKKANLIAKMIRGQSVPDAVHILERTNKKAARIFQELLRSAMANASHNEKQDPQMMMIKLLTVNKAQCYHRGVPMARGRVRPMRKFMSHIHLTLGIAGDKVEEKKTVKEASQTAKKPVKKTVTTAKKPSTSTKGKSTKDTTTSTSKSSTSPSTKT